jgi:hypothetical protein
MIKQIGHRLIAGKRETAVQMPPGRAASLTRERKPPEEYGGFGRGLGCIWDTSGDLVCRSIGLQAADVGNHPVDLLHYDGHQSERGLVPARERPPESVLEPLDLREDAEHPLSVGFEFGAGGAWAAHEPSATPTASSKQLPEAMRGLIVTHFVSLQISRGLHGWRPRFS